MQSVGRIESVVPVERDLLRRQAALRWLKSNWFDIENKLVDPPYGSMLAALVGHTKAEFWRCFLRPEPQSMEHYVRQDDAVTVSSSLGLLLFKAITPLASTAEQGLKNWWGKIEDVIPFNREAAARKWIQIMLTGFYCNCFENFNGSRYDYVPAASRADLGFLMQNYNVVTALYPRQMLAQAIFPSVATRILQKTVESGGREYLVENVVNWCISSEGTEVCQRFAALDEEWPQMSPGQRNSRLENIRQILEGSDAHVGSSGPTYSLTIAGVPTVTQVKAVVSGRSWLHDLRHSLHGQNPRRYLKELVTTLIYTS